MAHSHEVDRDMENLKKIIAVIFTEWVVSIQVSKTTFTKNVNKIKN